MSNRAYETKLRDPRWQKRRLEVFNKANFACELCADTTSPLHAHHVEYLSGRQPWEYSDLYLMSVSDACHNLCHFTGTKLDLKEHVMERHGFGTMTDSGTAFLFMIHGLGEV